MDMLQVPACSDSAANPSWFRQGYTSLPNYARTGSVGKNKLIYWAPLRSNDLLCYVSPTDGSTFKVRK